MELCVAVLLLTTFCGTHALRNNLIRTSAETLDQHPQVSCLRDSDCEEQQYCAGQSQSGSVCVECGTERQRCHTDNMCCAGFQCVNEQCRKRKKRQKGNRSKAAAVPDRSRRKKKGQEMATCVRSGDCDQGLCCRRYLKDNKCVRIPVEGEACSLLGAIKGPRALQRCHCAPGLTCYPQDRNQHGVCILAQPEQKGYSH